MRIYTNVHKIPGNLRKTYEMLKIGCFNIVTQLSFSSERLDWLLQNLRSYCEQNIKKNLFAQFEVLELNCSPILRSWFQVKVGSWGTETFWNGVLREQTGGHKEHHTYPFPIFKWIPPCLGASVQNTSINSLFLRGNCTQNPKLSMFCVFNSNYQHFLKNYIIIM